MTIGADTYIHDVLAACGAANVFADAPARYPAVTLDEVAVRRPDVILLPDEPFRFRRAHLDDFARYATCRPCATAASISSTASRAPGTARAWLRRCEPFPGSSPGKPDRRGAPGSHRRWPPATRAARGSEAKQRRRAPSYRAAAAAARMASTMKW